jgi:hypothetical protein
MEALPLKELLIGFNGSNSTYKSACNGNPSNLTDCMEIKKNITITNDECPINNSFEMIFDYKLDNRLNCIDAKTIGPFNYKFNMNCNYYTEDLNIKFYFI